MKAVDIAIKDMRQSYRNKGAIIFMFVIPILVTVLFYFMFGNIAAGDEAFALPQTAVILVNLDEGDAPGVGSMGEILAETLQGENLAEIVTISEMQNARGARTAVENQEAGVAIIVPAGFTSAVTGEGDAAEVEIYRDPTLTIGPAIVNSIVSQVIDGMSSANIGIDLTLTQLAEAGVPITPEMVQEIVEEYTTGFPQQGTALTNLQAPDGQESGNELAQMLAFILAGMMVFFAFFTGANMFNSILTEQENGTLQRLFTTPTSYPAIFNGKFFAALIVLTVQVFTLLIFGRLVFNIEWGDPLPVILAAAGLILIAATTGLFLVSFMKTTRQAGIIFGGLLTLTGMLGLFPVFTAGAPNTPQALEAISLLVPQGWAIRIFNQAKEGEPWLNIAITFIIILLWSGVFFFLGQYRLRKRFA